LRRSDAQFGRVAKGAFVQIGRRVVPVRARVDVPRLPPLVKVLSRGKAQIGHSPGKGAEASWCESARFPVVRIHRRL
jgi:hypothetical protein